MVVNLLAGIVRILLGPNKETAGTGFVVNKEGLVVTCAHVVEDAHAGPGDTVSLIFYAAKDKGEHEATVLPKYWCASNAEDVAFLHLKEEKIPEGVEPLPLGCCRGKTNFSTFGFPGEALTSGRRGIGTVLGLPHEMMGFSRLQLRSEEITKGFSGAPVWDDERQCVIGMVDAIRQGRSILLGGQEWSLPIDPHGRFQYEASATPTETLWEIYPDLRPGDQCPYHGLKEFTRSDAPYFFGRESVLNKLVESLWHEPQFLAVLGPSGSGKSSLIQAGLLPLLEKEAVFSSNQWEIIPTRPTDGTFKEKITSLHQKQQPIALVIDQFEELFWAYSEEQCQEVVMLLKDLLERSRDFHLILTLRNDFYSRFVQLEALEKWLKTGMVNVPSTLQPDEVRDIIQKPAGIVHLDFDAGLVEIIVKDVLIMHPFSSRKEVGTFNNVLPLLEVALTELWKRRDDKDRSKLTLDAYRLIGGVTGGLKRQADETYTALTKNERELARRIFTQLVYANLIDANEDETPQILYTRRPRRKDDLIDAVAGDQSMAEQVIQRLTLARLLVTNRVGEQDTIELSHEALIYEWPTLSDLLDKGHDDILFQQSLSKDATEWELRRRKRKQSRDLLYRGDKLKQAKAWMRDNVPNAEEAAFIQASATQGFMRLMLVLAVVLLLVPLVGFAGWYVFFQPSKTLVSTLKDNDEVGSLRWCINNAPSGSTITFDRSVRGIIELTEGDLLFSGDKRLTIEGPGANQLAITGGNRNVIIHISKGATLNFSGLSFKNSITNTNAFLLNEGTLTLTNSIISNNKTNALSTGAYGGGIENRGRLSVIDSTISNNTAIGPFSYGGGIYNAGQLIVNHSIVSKNVEYGDIDGGGGIWNYTTGTIVVTNNSIISNNVVQSGDSATANEGSEGVACSMRAS